VVYVGALIAQLRMISTGASADRVTQIEDAAIAGARRLGNPHVDADLLNARGYLRLQRGDSAEARALLEQADARYREVTLAAEPMHYSVLQNLGAICLETGDMAAADDYLDRAVALAHARFTETSVRYWEARTARATSYLFRNELAKAETELRATVAGLARVAPGSYQAGMAHMYLCAALLGQQQLAGARAACAAAVANQSKALGETSAALVFPLALAGQVELHDKAFAAAIPLLERAAAIARAANVRPIERATAEAYLAVALFGAGRRAEARALAAKVAPALRGRELDEARGDFLRAFPELRATASGQ